MSILTGDFIKKAVKAGQIFIDPFNEDRVGPNSYDLALGSKLLRYRSGFEKLDKPLNVKVDNPVYEIEIPEHGFILRPGKLYLGHTIEKCGSDHYVCCLEGRSSVGRLGIQVHQTAGFGDLGFKQQWTLEITVVDSIMVFPRMKICQAMFYTVYGDIKKLYKGKYTDQDGPVPSRLYKDFDEAKAVS